MSGGRGGWRARTRGPTPGGGGSASPTPRTPAPGRGPLADADEAERDLVYLGAIGLENPLRPEVPAAVSRCHSAGVRVVMLTGDHGHTALVVARQAGSAEGGAGGGTR